ncbi:hypothetical protein GCM10009789_54140 [Kribbella sancticallisti]|uniref:Uncharacterized protein n=1 Tax=Kribbella sancticallisti TaxID=460087 RepID=A0ABN2E373_9ACTN
MDDVRQEVEKDSKGWPILRSAQDLDCDGKNPTTGRTCVLGYHRGNHRDETGTEWLDDE